jgi:hypothetical protein
MTQLRRPPEIDQHTTKLIVGLIALSLGPLTNVFADFPLTSISASYYHPGWSQTIFIGSLFATAAFLLSYNGLSSGEMISSKVAAAAGLAVALFPCDCDGRAALVPHVHGIAAAAMFLVLTYFCYVFRQRALLKASRQSRVRALIYTLCAAAMALSIVALALDQFTSGALSRHDPWLTYHGEYVALTAFGVSWLTASRKLPLLTAKNEREPLLAPSPKSAA